MATVEPYSPLPPPPLGWVPTSNQNPSAPPPPSYTSTTASNQMMPSPEGSVPQRPQTQQPNKQQEPSPPQYIIGNQPGPEDYFCVIVMTVFGFISFLPFGIIAIILLCASDEGKKKKCLNAAYIFSLLALTIGVTALVLVSYYFIVYAPNIQFLLTIIYQFFKMNNERESLRNFKNFV